MTVTPLALAPERNPWYSKPMQLSYTYWNAKEGGYIGYLNQYPDYWTQGDSTEELEQMLVSLYGDITQFDDVEPAVPEHIGSIAVPA